MKEFYQDHFDECDYCVGIYDGNLPQSEKDRLIDEHTMDAFANHADVVYEILKDQQYAPTN